MKRYRLLGRARDTDKNYKLVIEDCSKCRSTRHIPIYSGYDNGVCYDCRGAGTRGSYQPVPRVEVATFA